MDVTQQVTINDFDLNLGGETKISCGCGWSFTFGENTAMINMGVLTSLTQVHTKHFPLGSCDHVNMTASISGARTCLTCMKEL